MEVLPHGSGHGLFATRTYEVGEAIIVDEKPLFVIDAADSGAMELSIVLEKLKTVFDSITGPDQLTVLALFCPEDGELKLMDTLLAPVCFDKVDALARRLYPNLTTSNASADQNQLTKLFYIWKINSTRYQAQNSAVFEIHARMNHSCSPNATFRAGTIRAQKTIQAGQEITHSYLDMERSIASTPVRRHLLNQQFLFHCACSRCIRAVDLSRIMKCPACSKHALVPGFLIADELQSREDNDKADTKEVAATCTLCSETFAAESLPLEEEGELENTVLTLWNQLASPHTQTSPIVQIQQLHKSVIQVLGAAHWTAAAMTKIRYDTDPMVNGFIILSWGEAYANWCQAITKDDIPLLAPMITFTIGRNCEPLTSKPSGTQKKLFEISGRRYWNECYPLCRKLWGTVDPNVLEMEQMFSQSKKNNCRVDLVVCTDRLCTNKTDDDIQAQSDNQEKKKACAACGLAHYCGRNCQKEDWNAHKEVCKSTRDLKDLVAVVGALQFARRGTE